MSHILCNVYIVYVNGFYKVEVLQLTKIYLQNYYYFITK